MYINLIMKKYPPLTKQEEEDMIKEYTAKNDLEGLKQQLVLRNVGIIGKIGKNWNKFYTSDEIVSYGIEGLMKATNSFNYNKKYRFNTYAWKAVIQSLNRHRKDIRSKIDNLSISFDNDSLKLPRDYKGEFVNFRDKLESKILDEVKNIKQPIEHLMKEEGTSITYRILKLVDLTPGEKDVFQWCFIDGKKMCLYKYHKKITRQRISKLYMTACRKIRHFILGDNFGKLVNLEPPQIEDYNIEDKSYRYRSFLYDNKRYEEDLAKYRELLDKVRIDLFGCNSTTLRNNIRRTKFDYRTFR